MDAFDNPLNFHRETYVSERSGLPIYVACYCELRRDHTYPEWVELYADDKWQARYAANLEEATAVML
ncbi:hypothetical protein ACFOYW_07800 [Gryllotalpicola reticulitermitis]|uniref:Uncharacterized protein n=1 Tax=Gryllotalpicola reticulitermitis TaxID=1184153 RepID=A0ABV8Q747_9MICO